MARSRKDSTGSVPVETYRKQIAKQDMKKSNASLKEIKFRAQKKENSSAQYKDIATMIGAMLIVGVCVYCILYALVSPKTVAEPSSGSTSEKVDV